MSGYEYTPSVLPILASAALIGAISAYVWRRRADTKGAFALGVLGFLLVLWCLDAAAEVMAVDVATQREWFVFRDALTMPGVILAFWFALQYAGLERWLTRPIGALLAILVVAHITLEYVDGGRLLWSSIAWDREIQGNRTPLGLAFAAFAILMFVLATAVFLLLFVRSPAHRGPVALILVGQLAMRVVYPIGVFNVVYVPNIVLGVVGFDVVAVMYAIALFRFRLFDLVPVARQTIIERMPDAMFVLDVRGHVADANAAARRLLGPAGGSSGVALADTLPTRPELVAAAAGSADHSSEVVLAAADGPRTCQVGVTALTDWQGRSIGRLVLLHDITELRAAQGRLLEQERALTAAREREHMARDLHDSLGQVLGYLGLQVATIRKLVADGRLDRVDERLARVGSIAGEAQTDVRRTIADLSRPPSTDADLVGSLRGRLEAAERDYGIATSLTIDPSAEGADVPSPEAAHLLRIVDEALTNAIRHGEAHHARVSLERDDGLLALSVEDDGIGFETARVPAGSDGRYGLRFMHERATELGGCFEVVSAPGQGTRVSVRVPCQADPTTVAR